MPETVRHPSTLHALVRPSLRNRAAAWLLSLGLLLGQLGLFLHHYDHSLADDNGGCALCLVGQHTGSAPLPALHAAVTPAANVPVASASASSANRFAPLAFRARAPPAPFLG
ncbi:MAG: hypothetical protein KDG50_03640 [Chromatiales bacterium]|nr:hypothetical protein [Chromatiales bacterium]